MAGQIKQVLEKEVTCPLCLDLFKEPKKLPCDHVYCKDCLKGLALCSLDKSISCPECRNVADIPNNDVTDFPTAFRVNRLVEAFQTAREETDHHGQNNTARTCTVHTTQPLALYCNTCKTMLCRDCVLMTKDHEHHEYDYIDNVSKKYRKQHKTRLQMMKEYGELLSQAQAQISETASTIAHKKSTNLEEIDHAFVYLHNTLEQSKEAVKRKLSQEYQLALNAVLEQKCQTEIVQAETARVTTLIEGALQCQNEALVTQEEFIETNLKSCRNKSKNFLSWQMSHPSH